MGIENTRPEGGAMLTNEGAAERTVPRWLELIMRGSTLPRNAPASRGKRGLGGAEEFSEQQSSEEDVCERRKN